MNHLQIDQRFLSTVKDSQRNLGYLSKSEYDFARFFPDVIPYNYRDKKSYLADHESLKNRRLMVKGFDIRPVGWFRYQWEAFRGFIGFENRCTDAKAVLALKKFEYYGYVKGYLKLPQDSTYDTLQADLINVYRTSQADLRPSFWRRLFSKTARVSVSETFKFGDTLLWLAKETDKYEGGTVISDKHYFVQSLVRLNPRSTFLNENFQFIYDHYKNNVESLGRDVKSRLFVHDSPLARQVAKKCIDDKVAIPFSSLEHLSGWQINPSHYFKMYVEAGKYQEAGSLFAELNDEQIAVLDANSKNVLANVAMDHAEKALKDTNKDFKEDFRNLDWSQWRTWAISIASKLRPDIARTSQNNIYRFAQYQLAEVSNQNHFCRPENEEILGKYKSVFDLTCLLDDEDRQVELLLSKINDSDWFLCFAESVKFHDLNLTVTSHSIREYYRHQCEYKNTITRAWVQRYFPWDNAFDDNDETKQPVLPKFIEKIKTKQSSEEDLINFAKYATNFFSHDVSSVGNSVIEFHVKYVVAAMLFISALDDVELQAQLISSGRLLPFIPAVVRKSVVIPTLTVSGALLVPSADANNEDPFELRIATFVSRLIRYNQTMPNSTLAILLASHYLKKYYSSSTSDNTEPKLVKDVITRLISSDKKSSLDADTCICYLRFMLQCKQYQEASSLLAMSEDIDRLANVIVEDDVYLQELMKINAIQRDSQLAIKIAGVLIQRQNAAKNTPVLGRTRNIIDNVAVAANMKSPTATNQYNATISKLMSESADPVFHFSRLVAARKYDEALTVFIGNPQISFAVQDVNALGRYLHDAGKLKSVEASKDLGKSESVNSARDSLSLFKAAKLVFKNDVDLRKTIGENIAIQKQYYANTMFARIDLHTDLYLLRTIKKYIKCLIQISPISEDLVKGSDAIQFVDALLKYLNVPQLGSENAKTLVIKVYESNATLIPDFLTALDKAILCEKQFCLKDGIGFESTKDDRKNHIDSQKSHFGMLSNYLLIGVRLMEATMPRSPRDSFLLAKFHFEIGMLKMFYGLKSVEFNKHFVRASALFPDNKYYLAFIDKREQGILFDKDQLEYRRGIWEKYWHKTSNAAKAIDIHNEKSSNTFGSTLGKFLHW